MRRLRALRHRARSQRGTAVVESAIALPVFLLVVFGALEFGLAFRSYLTMTAAARDSSRYAATMGRDPYADYYVISDAMNSLSNVAGSTTVTKIVVFKATGPTSTTASGALAACRNGSIANTCNTYIGANITTNADFYGCGASAIDRFWCPTTRKDAVSDPPDYIGIYIEMRHQGITGVIGDVLTFSDEVVARIEPVRK